MRALDVTDKRYRVHYFLRRSIATLVEFAEALRLLNACSDFVVVKSTFDDEVKRRWNDGIKFFADQEEFLKPIRNDTGGHFGPQAALYAIEHLNPGALGKIEADNKTLHLHFAGEIAATAILRHLEGQSTDVGFKNLLKTVLIGYQHSTTCVHCLAVTYLWQKFA
jgi:hypothetical protein